MERYVRKATAEDLPAVLDLIESGRRIMRENGNPHQWGDSHPTVAQIEDDIANGCSYLLLEDGSAIATFAFIPGPDVTYAVIYDGHWTDADSPYYVLHRVASAHGQHGRITSPCKERWQRQDFTTVASSICSTVMNGWLIRR